MGVNLTLHIEADILRKLLGQVLREPRCSADNIRRIQKEQANEVIHPLACAFAVHPTMIEIPALMRKLAIERPLFHSEADFQHALAWRIREEHPDSGVRMEYKPPTNAGEERMQLDIWLARLGVAIELKYKTGKPKKKITQDGESFDLRHQSAHDNGRYDFLKDIQRLEGLSGLPDVKEGFAIFLTNDDLYWRGPIGKDTFDAQFSLRGDPGFQIQGVMAWRKEASARKSGARKKRIQLKGSYEAKWRKYRRVADERYGEFRYLMVRVSRPK